MQSVSTAFKNKCVDNRIQRKLKLEVDWINNKMDSNGTITTSGDYDSSKYPPSAIVNGITTPRRKHAVSGHFASGQNYYSINTSKEVGWWSSYVSDENGSFSTPVTWQILYDNPKTIKSISVYGDPYISYPVNYNLYVSLNGVDWSLLQAYIDQTTYYSTYNFSSACEVYGINVEISKISEANMYAILLEVNTGWREDISDDLIEFYINKEKDYDSGTIPIGNISANTLTAMLRNTHNKYTPNNPSSPVYDYLKSNRKLIASVGYELDDGSIEWVEQGTFYSDDWTPTGITCIVKARDRAKFLLDINYSASTIYQNKRISDLVKQLVEDFGLSSDEYSIQDTSASIPYSWFKPASYWYLISLLAQAEGGAAYFDEGNKFNFINRNGLTDWNLRATFTDSHLFDLKQGYKPGRMRNKIKIKAMPVDISASEVVYTLLETLVISASDTETITIFFDRGPALNVLDASYTASGGSLTLDSQTNYAWGSTLVFINSHATESASITELTITADILTVKAERYLTAQDDDLIWDYGEQEYSLEDNYLLQDYDDAQQLADDELASWKDPNAELQIQTVGFPHLQIGDKLRVNSIKWATDDYFQIYAIEVEGRIAVLTTFSARKTLAIYIEWVQTTWIGGSGFLAWQNTKDKFYSEENINYSIAGQFTLI